MMDVSLGKVDYRPDGYYQPGRNPPDPTWDVVLQDVAPSTDRYGVDGGGVLRLPVPYMDVYACNLLKLVYDGGPTLYAWITKARPLSEFSGAEVTEIVYAVDAWRTWWTSATVRACKAVRGPQSQYLDYCGRQQFPVQYWRKEGTSIRLWPRTLPYWVVVNGIENDVPISWYIPFVLRPSERVTLLYGVNSYTTPTLDEVMSDLQSALQLTTARIAFVGWTDFPIARTESEAGGLRLKVADSMAFEDGWSTVAPTMASSPRFVLKGSYIVCVPFTASFSAPRRIRARYQITGYSDEPIDDLPWMDVATMDSVFVNGFTSAYIRIILLEGVIEWQVPVRPLPLGEDSYSDYLYSGMRQFEVSMKEQERQTSLFRGLLGAATGGMQTGAYGMIGANTQAAGATTAAGAAGAAAAAGAVPAMAALSAASGLASAVGDWFITGDYNQQSQKLKDRYMEQTGGIAMLGQSVYDLVGRQGVRIEVLVPDPPSDSMWARSLEYYGVGVDRYEDELMTKPVNSFGGPYKMTSIELDCPGAPPWAVSQLKRMLERGVYID